MASGELNRGQGNALTVKLLGAINKLDDGNVQAALGRLQAFVAQVTAFITAGVLAPEDGQPLIDQATAVINFLTQLCRRAF